MVATSGGRLSRKCLEHDTSSKTLVRSFGVDYFSTFHVDNVHMSTTYTSPISAISNGSLELVAGCSWPLASSHDCCRTLAAVAIGVLESSGKGGIGGAIFVVVVSPSMPSLLAKGEDGRSPSRRLLVGRAPRSQLKRGEPVHRVHRPFPIRR